MNPKAVAARDLARRKREGQEIKRGRPPGSKGKPKETPVSTALAQRLEEAPHPARTSVPVPRATSASVVASTGAIRRLQALVAIGYQPGELAQRLGISPDAVWFAILTPPDRLSSAAAERIAEVYRDLARLPRAVDEKAERATPTETCRRLADRLGWGSPVAWDDIDTDPEPVRTTLHGRRPFGEAPRPRASGPAATTVDQARLDDLDRELRETRAESKRLLDDATTQLTASENRVVDLRQSLASKEREVREARAAADDASIRASEADVARREAEQSLRANSGGGAGEYVVQADDSLVALLSREIALLRLRGQEVTLICGESKIVGELVEVTSGPEPSVQVALPGMPVAAAIPLPLDSWTLVSEESE